MQSNGCSKGKPIRPLQSPMNEELMRIEKLLFFYIFMLLKSDMTIRQYKNALFIGKISVKII